MVLASREPKPKAETLNYRAHCWALRRPVDEAWDSVLEAGFREPRKIERLLVQRVVYLEFM